MNKLQQPPLSLYIHIPWCVRKCPYCDFNSHERNGQLPEAAYIDSLLEDLDQDLHLAQGRNLQSIFFGGGTPSLFSARAIDRILSGVQQRISFSDDIEITLEANPGTAEQEKFRGYRAAGINRLSIGVQSFHPQQLERLGRIHTGDEASNAIDMARRAGFLRCNIDLMHGLPEQSDLQAMDDLQIALDLGATHVSWYQLTIEPNTAFYKQPPSLPDDNILADIQDHGLSLLQSRGLNQYEVSAFASEEQASRHNLNYWQFGDYLGLGAGAHSKISHPETWRVQRFQKTRRPEDYLQRQGSRTSQQHIVEPCDLPMEFMMNALRLTEGVPSALFFERTGLELTVIEPILHDLRHRGLLEDDDTRITASTLGRRYLNDVVAAFLPD